MHVGSLVVKNKNLDSAWSWLEPKTKLPKLLSIESDFTWVDIRPGKKILHVLWNILIWKVLYVSHNFFLLFCSI